MRRLALLVLPALVACRSADPEPMRPGDTAQVAVADVAPQTSLLRSFEVACGDGESLPSHVPAVAFTPDGATLWLGTAQGEAIAFDAASRAQRARARFTDAAIAAVAIDRAGRTLVWLGADGALEARSLERDEVLARVDRIEGAASLAVAPAGDLVAVGTAQGAVELRSLPGLALVAVRAAHEGDVGALAFSPDGERLASASADGRLIVASARDLAPQHEESVGAPLFAVCWTPDGREALFGGQQNVVDRLRVEGWEVERLVEDQPYFITTLGVSPDGSRLAIGDESCDVWIYDLVARRMIFHGKHHVECWLSSVAWAPDSETFLFGCRPNTLAPTPALFVQNRVVEALQDPTCQQAVEDERALLRDLAAQAERGELGEDGAALAVALREEETALARSSYPAPELGLSLSGGGGGGGVLAFDAEEEAEGATGAVTLGLPLIQSIPLAGMHLQRPTSPARGATALAASAERSPAAKAALDRLTALRGRREQVVREKLDALGRTFQVNVWRAAKSQ